jgi:hypothetical protein
MANLEPFYLICMEDWGMINNLYLFKSLCILTIRFILLHTYQELHFTVLHPFRNFYFFGTDGCIAFY